jgi:hypothetical protein
LFALLLTVRSRFGASSNAQDLSASAALSKTPAPVLKDAVKLKLTAPDEPASNVI